MARHTLEQAKKRVDKYLKNPTEENWYYLGKYIEQAPKKVWQDLFWYLIEKVSSK